MARIVHIAWKYRAPDRTLGEIVAPGRYPAKDGSKLSRIVHVALKVNDLESATEFYENVLRFPAAHHRDQPRASVTPHDRWCHDFHPDDL